jgi:hypothetical protein
MGDSKAIWLIVDCSAWLDEWWNENTLRKKK